MLKCLSWRKLRTLLALRPSRSCLAVMVIACVLLKADRAHATATPVTRQVQFSGQLNLTGISSGHTLFVWLDVDNNSTPVESFVQPLGDFSAGSHSYSFTRSMLTGGDSAVYAIIGETGASDLVLMVPTAAGDNAVTKGLSFTQLFPGAPDEQTLHNQLAADAFGSGNAANQATLIQMIENAGQNVTQVPSGLQQKLDTAQMQNVGSELIEASIAQHVGTASTGIVPAPEPATASLLLIAGAGGCVLRPRRSR